MAIENESTALFQERPRAIDAGILKSFLEGASWRARPPPRLNAACLLVDLLLLLPLPPPLPTTPSHPPSPSPTRLPPSGCRNEAFDKFFVSHCEMFASFTVVSPPPPPARPQLTPIALCPMTNRSPNSGNSP
jgi:hypothetical protein